MTNLFKELTETELQARETATRQSNNSLTMLKSFLFEHIKELQVNKSYELPVKAFADANDIHYYAIRKATMPLITKGKAKGKSNPDFDKELTETFKIDFDLVNKGDNARITAIRVKRLK